MSKIKEALNETLIEYQGSLPTVNGKASVAEWNLTIKFYTREQCYKFIDLLSKQEVVYSFSFYHQQHLYKAIYWDNGWIPWRRDGSPDLSRVLGFVPCTRAAYYTKCMGIFEREVRQDYKTKIDNEKFLRKCLLC